jgi:hypothetical protein
MDDTYSLWILLIVMHSCGPDSEGDCIETRERVSYPSDYVRSRASARRHSHPFRVTRMGNLFKLRFHLNKNHRIFHSNYPNYILRYNISDISARTVQRKKWRITLVTLRLVPHPTTISPALYLLFSLQLTPSIPQIRRIQRYSRGTRDSWTNSEHPQHPPIPSIQNQHAFTLVECRSNENSRCMALGGVTHWWLSQ